MTGLFGLVAYVPAASVVSYLYVYKFLGADEEAVETKDVLKDHFMNGFFPFFVFFEFFHAVLDIEFGGLKEAEKRGLW